MFDRITIAFLLIGFHAILMASILDSTEIYKGGSSNLSEHTRYISNLCETDTANIFSNSGVGSGFNYSSQISNVCVIDSSSLYYGGISNSNNYTLVISFVCAVDTFPMFLGGKASFNFDSAYSSICQYDSVLIYYGGMNEKNDLLFAAVSKCLHDSINIFLGGALTSELLIQIGCIEKPCTDENLRILLYPNPVRENIHIKSIEDIDVPIKVTIYSIKKELIRFRYYPLLSKDEVITINISDINSGNYILNIEGKENQVSYLFNIQ